MEVNILVKEAPCLLTRVEDLPEQAVISQYIEQFKAALFPTAEKWKETVEELADNQPLVRTVLISLRCDQDTHNPFMEYKATIQPSLDGPVIQCTRHQLTDSWDDGYRRRIEEYRRQRPQASSQGCTGLALGFRFYHGCGFEH